MNTPSATSSRSDGIVISIGVLVLFLGTATNDANAMLIMSLLGLVLISVFFRESLGTAGWLLMLIGASTAAAVGCIIATL